MSSTETTLSAISFTKYLLSADLCCLVKNTSKFLASDAILFVPSKHILNFAPASFSPYFSFNFLDLQK